jgi:hypothetical protein
MKLGTIFNEHNEHEDIEWGWQGEGYQVSMIVGDNRIGTIEIDELIALGRYFEKRKELDKNI